MPGLTARCPRQSTKGLLVAMRDAGTAFGYVFKDASWVTKLVVAGAMTLVPILGSVGLAGFLVGIARNVLHGHTHPMPRWDDFMPILKDGLYAIVIQLVFLLPYLAYLALLAIAVVGLSFLGEQAAGVALAVLVLGTLLSIPLILLLVMLSFAGIVRYLHTATLADALNFGAAWGMVAQRPVAWLLLLLWQFVTGIVALSGILACGFGTFVTTPYAQAVFGHLLGQQARAFPLPGQHHSSAVPPLVA